MVEYQMQNIFSLTWPNTEGKLLISSAFIEIKRLQHLAQSCSYLRRVVVLFSLEGSENFRFFVADSLLAYSGQNGLIWDSIANLGTPH